MTTVGDLLEQRAAASSDPEQFRLGYQAGEKASPGEDTEGYLQALLAQGDTAAAAGYLEGLAARARREMPAHFVNCRCPHCTYQHRYRMRQAAIAAETSRKLPEPVPAVGGVR
ncbi:hypothetical protein ACFY97_18415 [Streptomyces klenkii]|uniref:hypothetical protein n=1 Tax=Streptomyces klenkii TaxID=1420899 RepID=UPI0036E5FEA7